MPIFEFVCKECDRVFEDLVLNLSRMDEVVCPSCGSGNVKKKMSTFSSKSAGGSSFPLNTNSASSCSTGSV